MVHVNRYHSFGLLPILLLACGWATAQVQVREITIRSGWGGLGAPQDQTILIRAKNGTLVCNGKRVDQSSVDALIAALRASVISEPHPSNLGLTPTWLDEQIADQKGRFRLEVARATASQRALLTATLKDRQKIERIVPALFKYVRTDDYPGATVEVTFEDGAQLKAETHSYYPFMLPWSVGTQGDQTYNADISRAVANLLGKKSPNKDRLGGSTFAYELIETTKRSIDREWNLLGSEDRAGDALAALRTRYEVLASEINPYHHPEYGTATYKGEPEQVNLHATLRRSTFPSGVSVALVLQRVQGKVEGVDHFLASAAKYESLALSVPWLSQYIKDNPRVPVRISYVQDRSFGDKALRTFTEDMRFRDRPDLIEQVRAQQQDLALLIVGNTYSETYWILFPDKHMLLWRFGGASGLLKWSAADFSAGECADYKTNYGGCSGRVITPDGDLSTEPTARDRAITTFPVLSTYPFLPSMSIRAKPSWNALSALSLPILLCSPELGSFRSSMTMAPVVSMNPHLASGPSREPESCTRANPSENSWAHGNRGSMGVGAGYQVRRRRTMAGATSIRQEDGPLSRSFSGQAHSRMDWLRSIGPETAAILTRVAGSFCSPRSHLVKPIVQRYGVTS